MHQLKEEQSQPVSLSKASSEILPLYIIDADSVPQWSYQKQQAFPFTLLAAASVCSILCSSIQLVCITWQFQALKRGMLHNSIVFTELPYPGGTRNVYSSHKLALLHLQGNLKKKRNAIHAATLPSDNMPRGTGWIQIHSSCTSSCKLLGLHLSGSRNGQVSPVLHDSSKVAAAESSMEASCSLASAATAQPSLKETEARTETVQELPQWRFLHQRISTIQHVLG